MIASAGYECHQGDAQLFSCDTERERFLYFWQFGEATSINWGPDDVCSKQKRLNAELELMKEGIQMEWIAFFLFLAGFREWMQCAQWLR